MDTSAVTQGEIPAKVFTVGAKTEINISAGYIKTTDIHNYVYADPILQDARVCEDMIDNTGSLTITPKITLKSIGDKMIELRGSIIKENI